MVQFPQLEACECVRFRWVKVTQALHLTPTYLAFASGNNIKGSHFAVFTGTALIANGFKKCRRTMQSCAAI